MENYYLLDFYRDNKLLQPELFDNLKYELDQHIYYYGNHFKYPKEKNAAITKRKAPSILKLLFVTNQILKYSKIDSTKKTILSNSYFNVNCELRKLDYNVFSPSWSITPDRKVLASFKLFSLSEKLRHKLESASFLELTSKSFYDLISNFYDELASFYFQKKIAGLVVPNDVSFFENLSIQLCRKISVPSFVFLHGLPGRYNIIDENRSDYLIVWGEKIKENYIKTGFNPEKIFISGHPYYNSTPDSKLRFSLDNILILTKSMNGSQHGNEVILGDRGNLLLYLFKIQSVLKSLGVKRVRYRPHPSENPLWYHKFIDQDFFVLDTAPLNQSLSQATLVIGPTSTVLVESIFNGVNFLIFEPNKNNIDILNYPLVPPFDGSDSRVPIAQSESDLMNLIKNRNIVDVSFLKEYLKTPFNLDFIRKLI